MGLVVHRIQSSKRSSPRFLGSVGICSKAQHIRTSHRIMSRRHGCCFKPLSFGVVCLAAKLTDTRGKQPLSFKLHWLCVRHLPWTRRWVRCWGEQGRHTNSASRKFWVLRERHEIIHWQQMYYLQMGLRVLKKHSLRVATKEMVSGLEVWWGSDTQGEIWRLISFQQP